MRRLFPRPGKGKSRPGIFGDQPVDIFEQPDRSLLGEALSRPVGFCAAFLLVASTIAFLANHLYLRMDRVNDFALVGFFVGGGILLSMLLRSTDQPAGTAKKTTTIDRVPERETELVLEDEAFEERRKPVARPGLAEEAPSAVPVPPQALLEPEAVKPVSDSVDNEVASFQKALVHYANAGDFHGQGEILRRLGHLAKGRGHLKESREFYMNSRNCFRKIGDHYAEAAVLLDLGQVLESLDEHDAASAAYRDANRALLDVAMNSSDRYNAIQAHAAD